MQPGVGVGVVGVAAVREGGAIGLGRPLPARERRVALHRRDAAGARVAARRAPRTSLPRRARTWPSASASACVSRPRSSTACRAPPGVPALQESDGLTGRGLSLPEHEKPIDGLAQPVTVASCAQVLPERRVAGAAEERRRPAGRARAAHERRVALLRVRVARAREAERGPGAADDRRVGGAPCGHGRRRRCSNRASIRRCSRVPALQLRALRPSSGLAMPVHE